ncbi:MAG: methyl-accepting chemotaxis protein [Pseudomonadota bacterium]
MHLKSRSMRLTGRERRWLPWLGKTGKLALGWSCFLNRRFYASVENIFEGIASTRMKLLIQWAETHWEHLGNLAEILASEFPEVSQARLATKLRQAPDFSELFVIDAEGSVLASTHAARLGARDLLPQAVMAGLQAPFLHGPYVDRATGPIGPSTSKFHDDVTLMFYQPIRREGRVLGCLCGRVPNDVLGDLIQREAGHVYPESGDNYLFMVESRFDPMIQPGTALSRSRFEDDTFSYGENLKSGVHTPWGTVRVKAHTELELRFTDPATGELHPGVRETIRQGENLFVTYPGYSDYRHVPVIGKGVTFQMPGSPDRWGMMCEGDLEEVYRRRSVSFRLMRWYLGVTISLWLANILLTRFSGLTPLMVQVATGALFVMGGAIFYRFGTASLSRRLNEMTDVIRTIAEGEGNLRQRLDSKRFKADETGEMGRWINSFIDNLDGIVGQVIQVAEEVRETNHQMLDRNQAASVNSLQVLAAIETMLDTLRDQMQEIESASGTASAMQAAMDEVVHNAQAQFAVVRGKTQGIRNAIEESSRSIRALQQRSEEIGKIAGVINDIADQTNLLALNAAIEAARAGEQGRGFAVVADEVRKLAERTTEATHHIHEMISNVQSEARQAVTVMENGMQGVEEGLRMAEETAGNHRGIEQVVQRMNAVIQTIAKGSEAQNRSARDTAEIAAGMQGVVDDLRQSADQVQVTAGKLQRLVGQFQVSRVA